jgi:YihY family inner membrane protein
VRQVLHKFMADRGTHLAAMIAYFALVSLVPMVFLALAGLALVGQPNESALLVRGLEGVLPSTSVERIVRAVDSIRGNAAAIGIIGGVSLLWSSLSLFSVLESALNIVYGQPNRSFIRGKGLAAALIVSSLLVLYVGLAIASIGVDVITSTAPGVVANPVIAFLASIAVSSAAVFLFLTSVYYLLTNADLRFRDVVPGALLATLALEVTFQALPFYVRTFDSKDTDIVSLQVFGAPLLLLIWLYLMANVIVLGAEVNWWWQYGRGKAEAEERVPGLA